VALDASFVGRSYPPSRAYEVGREKIREFADAIGDPDPVYRDADAARAAGYLDVIAPPTFAIVVTMPAQEALVCDPDLGLDYSKVVHREQSFQQHRPIRAGDRLVTTVHVDDIRTAAGSDLLTTRCEVSTEAGEPVLTARAVIVARGTAAGTARLDAEPRSAGAAPAGTSPAELAAAEAVAAEPAALAAGGVA
jgi:acyl dehydratase